MADSPSSPIESSPSSAVQSLALSSPRKEFLTVWPPPNTSQEDDINERVANQRSSPVYDADDDDNDNERYNQLSRFFEPPPDDVGVGLVNLGNSCFVNSVMQCFTHTVPLILSLLSYQYQYPCNCGNEVFCVIRALRSHIYSALTLDYSIAPYHIHNNLNYLSPDFRRYQQEDAHEFLQAFLDKLEKCCVDRRINSSEQEDNIVQRDFGGRLVSRLRCCECNSVSEIFENSFGLSLEIGDVSDLWSALQSFTSVEKLEDKMTCDDCKEKVLKEKQLLLDRLPTVATFHLKRFKNNGYSMEKIFKRVDFPLELDLQPYMSHSENNEVGTKYRLYAFVEHLGSLAFGHYVSYVRSSLETWHRFDDQKVTRIKEEDVLSRDSYILFYAREGTPWFSRAFDEMYPLIEASKYSYWPRSLLDPCNGECSSEITDDNVKREDYCVSLSGESNEDFFSDDDSLIEEELLDPVYDTYASCTEPSHQKEPDSITGDKFVPVAMVQKPVAAPKQQECCNQPVIGEYPNEFMSSSGESCGEDSSMSDLSGPLETDDSYGPGAEKESDSALTTCDELVPVLDVQNQDSSPNQQEGSCSVQLELPETAKNQEEEACKEPLLSDDVGNYMETEELVIGEVVKKPSPRARELYEVDAHTDGSPTKRIKTDVENEDL